MEKKKNCGHLKVLRNFFLSFAFCFICVLCFGTVRAQASVRTFDFSNSSYTITVPDSILEQYPYYYVTYDNYQGGTYYVYLLNKKVFSASDKGAFVSNEKNISWLLYHFGGSQRDFDIVSGEAFNEGIWYNNPVYIYNNGGSCLFSVYTSFVYSNTNIQYAEYDAEKKGYTVKSDSFFIPSLGVSIKMVQELPAEVISQTKVILPIAVSCLALLIGCLTLLPRLKVFLH